MIACCKMTYAKYINDDGTVDEEAYEQTIQQHEYEFGKEWAPIAFLLRGHPPCMCICHSKKYTVLH